MYLDQETANQIRLDEYLKEINPFTLLGTKQKQKMKPYLPTEVEAWNQDLAEQEWLKTQGFQEKTYLFEQAFSWIGEINQVLDQFKVGPLPSLSSWFEMKRFLVSCKFVYQEMDSQLIPPSLTPALKDVEVISSLYLHLHSSGERVLTFHFSDLNHTRWNQLEKRYKKIILRQKKRRKEQERWAIEEMGLTPNYLGEWVVPKGDPRVEEFARRNQFQLERETTIDVVYRLALTPADLALEQEKGEIEDQIMQTESEIFYHLSSIFQKKINELQRMAYLIGRLDFQWAKVRAGLSWNGVRPVYDHEKMTVADGYLPLEKQGLEREGSSFTPLSFQMSQGMVVIIGPNMGGKTMLLRMIGLFCSLAQYAVYVPANEFSFPLFSWIRASIGDGQSTEQGLSSFGAEMSRLSEWFSFTGKGLLLLDEIGRGTNPIEGAAIGTAVTKYLQQQNRWTIHVTHFSQVLEVKGIQAYRVAGLKRIPPKISGSIFEWKKQLQQEMDYRLLPIVEGEHVPLQAIQIAECLGIPDFVIKEARTQASLLGEEDFNE